VFEQVYQPVGGSLLLSTLVALVPIVTLFVLLAGVRLAAHWASLATLAVAFVIAVLVYGMPFSLAVNSTLLGICFELFPIVWIVINAIFIPFSPGHATALPHLIVRLFREITHPDEATAAIYRVHISVGVNDVPRGSQDRVPWPIMARSM